MFERLFQFWGCCFHQDFLDEYGTWQDAIQHFALENDVETISGTIDELDKFISLNYSEEKLISEMMVLGCYYYSPGDTTGLSQKEWLLICRDKLAHLRDAKKSRGR